jgi:hypothetical protein
MKESYKQKYSNANKKSSSKKEIEKTFKVQCLKNLIVNYKILVYGL